MSTVRELLYCWEARRLYVLVPKKRAAGFLRAPYGHHFDKGLSEVERAARCNLFGLDGALEFECPGSVYFGGEQARAPFRDTVMPMLEHHYQLRSREIGSNELWAILTPASK